MLAQAEEPPGVVGRLGRELVGRPAERARHRAQHVRQERRLVAARLGLGVHVARRKVGRVGLQQQAALHSRLAKGGAGALKAVTGALGLKDIKAEQEAVAAGFKARSDVVEAMGYDPEEVDARIAADRERERKLGLSFALGTPATKVVFDTGETVTPPADGHPG